MFRRLGTSPRLAIVEIAVLAFIVVFLFSVISIDANREQEAFNRGAIVLTAGDAAVCIVPLAIRLAIGKTSRSDVLMARVGFGILLLLSLAAYMILGSAALGRVL